MIDENEEIEQKIGGVELLGVMSKGDWLLWKNRIKKLKKEILGQNDDLCKIKATLKPNSLIGLRGLGSTGITKQELKIKLMHYEDPAYVDYKMGEDRAIIRFSSKLQKENFLSEIEVKPLTINQLVVEIEQIGVKEEKEYFILVNKRRKKYRNKNKKDKVE